MHTSLLSAPNWLGILSIFSSSMQVEMQHLKLKQHSQSW